MKEICVGDTVYFETLSGKIDSMAVVKIIGDKLYDSNDSFLTVDEVVKISRPFQKQPLEQEDSDKAVAWLESQSGKVITKKLINEFKNHMKGE